jgi:glutathione S-transferase
LIKQPNLLYHKGVICYKNIIVFYKNNSIMGNAPYHTRIKGFFMITLYACAGTCSTAVHALLKEIGADFQVNQISLKNGDHLKPEFLAINSRGQVPVLVTESGDTLREGMAILLYLADNFKQSWLPAQGMIRAKAIEWLAFGNSTLHPAYGRCFYLSRTAALDDTSKQVLLKEGVGIINRLWADVEKHLEENAFIAGKEMTLADVLLTVIAQWSPMISTDIEILPKTRALLTRVLAVKAVKETYSDENITPSVF